MWFSKFTLEHVVFKALVFTAYGDQNPLKFSDNPRGMNLPANFLS